LTSLAARVVRHEEAYRRAKVALKDATARLRRDGDDKARMIADERLRAYRRAEARLARSCEKIRQAIGE
jgi:hypothetical protein